MITCFMRQYTLADWCADIVNHRRNVRFLICRKVLHRGDMCGGGIKSFGTAQGDDMMKIGENQGMPITIFLRHLGQLVPALTNINAVKFKPRQK